MDCRPARRAAVPHRARDRAGSRQLSPPPLSAPRGDQSECVACVRGEGGREGERAVRDRIILSRSAPRRLCHLARDLLSDGCISAPGVVARLGGGEYKVSAYGNVALLGWLAGDTGSWSFLLTRRLTPRHRDKNPPEAVITKWHEVCGSFYLNRHLNSHIKTK